MIDPHPTTTRRDFLAGLSATVAGTVLAPGLAAGAGPSGSFRAGAAVTDITPKPGVLLDGPIMQIGPVTGVHDRLHARALAMDDGTERVAICLCDCTVVSREVFDRAKELAAGKTGLGADRMLFAATHSHSAVRAIGIGDGKLDREYLDLLAQRIAEAVQQAIANLAPARVGWGSGSLPELVYCRRWYMTPGSIPPNPFGQKTDQVRFNPPRGSKDLVRPAGPVDPGVGVLSVRHADGRPLAVLATFGMHYAGGFRHGEVSADYFGVFAERIAELLGAKQVEPPFVGIMCNGTSGDVSNGFDFRRPAPRKEPYAWMQEVGTTVAGEVQRVVGKIDHRGAVSLAMRQKELELGVRRPDEARLAWARDLWSKAQKLREANPKRRNTWPEIYAREAIRLSEYPPAVRLVLQAVRIGDLGIAAIPCEVFAETGLSIKQASPLKPTFAIELAGGYSGYLPTPQQHKLGGYETWPARSSLLEVEAETRIRRTALELLGAVAGQSRP